MYASAIGTTVLQSKAIPQRPSTFDGVVALFELETRDEATIASALKKVGTVVSCEVGDSWPPARVRFAAHKAAVAAKSAGLIPGVCRGVDTLYNERPYDERGWCAIPPNPYPPRWTHHHPAQPPQTHHSPPPYPITAGAALRTR